MAARTAVTAGPITADWATAFPHFDVWKKRRLLRRIGPVLQGICLDESMGGDAYRPTAHIHVLTRPFPVISLTMAQGLGRDGTGGYVLRHRHHQDFREAARSLAENSLLSLDAPPSLDDVINAYCAYAAEQETLSGNPPVVELEDVVLLSAVGAPSLVRQCLDLALELSARWRASRLPPDWPGTDVGLQRLHDQAANPAAIEAVIESQIALHKVANVRASAGFT